MAIGPADALHFRNWPPNM